MYIQGLIRRLFETGTAAFHDANGDVVPSNTITSEYNGIRNYLLGSLRDADIVAIRLRYDYRYLLGILACMEVGIPYVPLRVSWPHSRVEQIKRLSGCTVILDEDTIDSVCAFRGTARCQTFNTHADKPLYIIFTSGTTGEPKGVVIQRKAYEHFLHWIDGEITCTQDCRALFVADFTFDMSMLDVALFVLKQCGCYFSQFDGNLFRLAYEIDEYQISSIATVPNNINLLLQDNIFERSSFTSLKQLLLGGSRFSFGTYRTIQEKLPHLEALYNFYGPTEATVYCHFKRLTGTEGDEIVDSTVSIGRPAPGLTCQLLDAQGDKVVQPNTPGELYVGGVQVMREYVGDRARTTQSLVQTEGETYYRTGDVAFFDDAGNYYITGRKDETLKRRGYRINLLDIDSYIQRLESVQDSATIAIPDATTDHLLASFIIPRQRVPEHTLREQLAHLLVDYQMPDYLFYTDSFPLNNSGKVCKEALKALFAAKMTRAS